MNSVPFPASASRVRSGDSLSLYEALFFVALALFIAVACAWPVLAWRIHHFSTYILDAEHTFLVHERTGIIYLKPAVRQILCKPTLVVVRHARHDDFDRFPDRKATRRR
jgi:hypothetical protein